MRRERFKAIYKNSPILLGIGLKSMRATVRGMFRQIGSSEIVEAETGESVLTLLNKFYKEKSYFVILDWDIPGMPGVDVAREIRGNKRLENTPLLLMAEDAVAGDVALLGEIGVNGCVVKPLIFSLMQKKFEEIIYTRANPPEHVRIIKEGEDLQEKKNYKQALKLFTQSQDIKNSARVNVLIGESYEKMEEHKEALKHYQMATKINPMYIKAYQYAASLYLKLNDEENGLIYLGKAAQISPNNHERQALLGKLYMAKGDIVKAEEAFSFVVKIQPEKGKEIGEKFLEAGHSRTAENFFKKSIAFERRSIHTYNRLGIALRRQGKWQEAVDIYKKALLISHRDEGLYFNMGRSFIEGGRTYEAKESFHRALKLNPKMEEAREELAKLGKKK